MTREELNILEDVADIVDQIKDAMRQRIIAGEPEIAEDQLSALSDCCVAMHRIISRVDCRLREQDQRAAAPEA